MAIALSGPELAKLSPDLISSLQHVVPRLKAQDPTIWGSEAESEARIRLGWLTSATDAAQVLAQLSHLPRRRRTVLCGMGGSSLAPEVIAAAHRKELVTLDSTDPQQVAAALTDLADTTFVIASKSGSTIETDSQRRAVEFALGSADLDPKDHIVVITDPDSPLDHYARAQHYFVINADPNVGGRFSALTAFGLTPAYLIGVDIEQLINEANLATSQMSEDPSPAVLLAATIIRHNHISPYITIASDERAPGFGDWIEQLVAESTGKTGRGVLPIVVESTASADFTDADRLSISLHPSAADVVIDASLGAQFVLWEWATALVGFALKIDPFNQPNVTESKVQTSALLQEWSQHPYEPTPLFSEDGIDVFTGMDVTSIADLFDQLSHHAGYVAIMAYLDRTTDSGVSELRQIVARRRPCTFGWGPRFLHSTGQFHKGGPAIGAFLQITGTNTRDLNIPGQEYTFGTLQLAQAIGDFNALSSRDLPIARLHLHDRSSGITTLISKAAHAS